jgi:hypothetical protein
MKLFTDQIEDGDRTEDLAGGKSLLFYDGVKKECHTCVRRKTSALHLTGRILVYRTSRSDWQQEIRGISQLKSVMRS